MKNNVTKIANVNMDDVLNYLLPSINKIKKTYEFVGLSDGFINYLITSEVEKNGYFIKSKEFSIIIMNRINKFISNKIKLCFFSKDETYALLFKYINQNFKNTSNVEGIMKKLTKMNDFLNQYNYILEPTTIISLLENNELFNNAIKRIFKLYKNDIINGKIGKITNNELLINSISLYCLINKINIKNDIESNNESKLSNSAISDYISEIKKIRVLSFDEEKELAYKVKSGDLDARKEFIKYNLKLVLYVAKNYIGKGLEIEDLFEEGNLGLIMAVDKYDVTKGYRFASYANYWIRHAIVRAIQDKSRNIRIPVNINEDLYKYKQVVSKLKISLSREPNTYEVADEMNKSIKYVRFLEKHLMDTVSLNSLLDIEAPITDKSSYLDDIMINLSLREDLEKMLKDCKLSEREVKILKLRAGYYTKGPMTLKEIGALDNVSKQSINVIELGALYKIRKNENIGNLATYLDDPIAALERIEELKSNYEANKRKKRKIKTLN